jgi:hypothetical protein
VAKLSDLDFIGKDKAGKLNQVLTSAAITEDHTKFANRIYSYLRVAEATEHADTCVDPACLGCATPLAEGGTITRYNGVGFHEIVCYDLDNDPNTHCDKELKNCPYHYTKNGNQRVRVTRQTNLANGMIENDPNGLIKNEMPVTRVSRNSPLQLGQDDANATVYRWAEIDMGDWLKSDQEIIDLAATDDAEKLVTKSRTAVDRLSTVLKPGDIILTDNRLDANGRLYSDAEYIVWTGARLVEGMYPQFDKSVGSAAAFIGTENGATGPCIRSIADFAKLANYNTREQNWTVFRCVKPEMDNRYRDAGFYMASLTQKLVTDYLAYKKDNTDDFGGLPGYGVQW